MISVPMDIFVDFHVFDTRSYYDIIVDLPFTVDFGRFYYTHYLDCTGYK